MQPIWLHFAYVLTTIWNLVFPNVLFEIDDFLVDAL